MIERLIINCLAAVIHAWFPSVEIWNNNNIKINEICLIWNDRVFVNHLEMNTKSIDSIKL